MFFDKLYEWKNVPTRMIMGNLQEDKLSRKQIFCLNPTALIVFKVFYSL